MKRREVNLPEKRRGEERIHVVLAHRARGVFHSIEELFGTISKAFPSRVKCTQSYAPRGRAGPAAIFANLRWAASLRGGDLIHQTGDIHYAILPIRRASVVLTIHDLRFIDESRGLKRLLFWWLWLYLPCLRANRVTVISEFTKNRLLEHHRVPASKVRVIPNCVAADFKAAPKKWSKGKVWVLHVGTTDNKNLERVANGCSGLAVELLILGKMSEGQHAHLKRLKISYECFWDLPRDKVVDLYQSCDLVCFVSTYEGFGMPILEAQAVGRPVMTSDISPMKEVAGEGALLVDPFDMSAIRSGVVQLIEDAELREDLVEKGFCNVVNYSAESVAARYADLYEEVLQES